MIEAESTIQGAKPLPEGERSNKPRPKRNNKFKVNKGGTHGLAQEIH